MRPYKPALLSGATILLVAGALPVSAQRVPVVEAGGASNQQQSQQQTQQAAGVSNNNSQNEVLVNMYLQLEALQAEVQNLRGQVEEQSYQIRRMQMEQRDRYIDTDSRISELYNQVQANHGEPGTGVGQPRANTLTGNSQTANPPATSPAQPIPNQATASPALTSGNTAAAGAGIASSPPQSEQELYRQALNLLLEEEAYQESITLFQQYMDVYPQGRYYTNALYWQGAGLELVGNHNQAIVVLQRLINEYPQDPKAPTALLRLGTVYQEMGDREQAVALWQRITREYPDSTSEIRIATEYLNEINN